MTDDPRHFALQAALRRMRVHLEQAVADNDAAIAAWDAIDDQRINKIEPGEALPARERTWHETSVTQPADGCAGGDSPDSLTTGPWVEVTHFEDTEHQFQNAATDERRSGSPIIPRRWPDDTDESCERLGCGSPTRHHPLVGKEHFLGWSHLCCRHMDEFMALVAPLEAAGQSSEAGP